MKYKKYLAALMGTTMLAASLPTGVFAEQTTQTQAVADTSIVESDSVSEEMDDERPEGEAPSGEKPDGEAPGGEKPEKPDGEAPGGEKPEGELPAGGMGGANTQTYDYSGELSGTLTADGEKITSDGDTIAAEEKDQNALLALNGGSLTVTNGTVTKTGDDTDGDKCNFYGLNSIGLSVGEGSELTVSDTTLQSDSEGSNALFATDHATIYASNVSITTTAGNSRGLDATYGGTIVADSMDIQTGGDHSATVATDRGGGSISVTNSTLHTEGSGSPLLYSTGAIDVDQTTGTSTGSQIAGMEGLNTIMISNSALTSVMTERTASDPIANGVIIYQSTSGDAETSTGERALFQAVDSTLTCEIASGSMFYVTNTTADVLLSNTTLNFDSEHVKLLQIEGNDANNWGKAGSNGATVTFTALGEELQGDISVDTISSLDLYLLDSTSYTGSTEITENTANTETAGTPITINVSKDSVWTLTADSTVTNLNAEEGAQIVDAEGNLVNITVNGETIVEGTSALTVNVTGTYTNDLTIDEHNEIQQKQ